MSPRKDVSPEEQELRRIFAYNDLSDVDPLPDALHQYLRDQLLETQELKERVAALEKKLGTTEHSESTESES